MFRRLFVIIPVLLSSSLVACTRDHFFGSDRITGAVITPIPPQPEHPEPEPPLFLKDFGLISDNARCAMCHLTVVGDIAFSTSHYGDGFGLQGNTSGEIIGKVLTTAPLSPTRDIRDLGSIPPADLPLFLGGWTRIEQSLSPSEPYGVDPSLIPEDFILPEVTAVELSPKMKGTISGGTLATPIKNIHTGNLVLDGRSTELSIEGDILIDGDLVILGNISSKIGNLYVTGNIYIPDNLTMTDALSIFDRFEAAAKISGSQANEVAKDVIQEGAGGLSLASNKSIFLGWAGVTTDPRVGRSDSSQVINYTTAILPPPADSRERLSLYQSVNNFVSIFTDTNHSQRDALLAWLPDFNTYLAAERDLGVKLPKQEWDLDVNGEVIPTSVKCKLTKVEDLIAPLGSVARIDAVLYARQSVVGTNPLSGLVIRGGVMTKSFDFVGAGHYITRNPNAMTSLFLTYGVRHCDPTQDPNPTKFTGTSEIEVGANYAWPHIYPSALKKVLHPNVIDPMTGILLGDSKVVYDYRLRNGGVGLKYLRVEDK